MPPSPSPQFLSLFVVVLDLLLARDNAFAAMLLFERELLDPKVNIPLVLVVNIRLPLLRDQFIKDGCVDLTSISLGGRTICFVRVISNLSSTKTRIVRNALVKVRDDARN